jgi:hypothetical protein
VRCGWCGDEWHEGDLRGLGRLLSQRWVPVQVAAYLAARPESTIRDWMAGLHLASMCDLGSRKVLVDAVALAPLAESKRARKRLRGGLPLASELVTSQYWHRRACATLRSARPPPTTSEGPLPVLRAGPRRLQLEWRWLGESPLELGSRAAQND